MQKLTHTIEWEPLKGNYKILRITGNQRQPTITEAREYMLKNNLPEGVWVVGFLNNGEWQDFSECKTIELYEYSGYGDGQCPVCAKSIDWAADMKCCPTCGKEW